MSKLENLQQMFLHSKQNGTRASLGLLSLECKSSNSWFLKHFNGIIYLQTPHLI